MRRISSITTTITERWKKLFRFDDGRWVLLESIDRKVKFRKNYDVVLDLIQRREDKGPHLVYERVGEWSYNY